MARREGTREHIEERSEHLVVLGRRWLEHEQAMGGCGWGVGSEGSEDRMGRAAP